jgi:hypothetical protein
MFYKFVTLCSLAIVALQLLVVLEWTCLDLRQEIAMLQNAIAIQRIAMKTCSPEALEAAVDENARLRQWLVDLQGALMAAKFRSLKGGIQDGAPPLFDVIIQSQEGEWGKFHPSACIRWVVILTTLTLQAHLWSSAVWTFVRRSQCYKTQ